MFVFRVNNEVNEDTVRDHMTGKNMQFLSLKTMSNPEALFKSFLITVSAAELSNIMDPDIWPPGAKLREFRMPPGGLQYNRNGTEFS